MSHESRNGARSKKLTGVSVTLERMESTSSGGARTPGAAVREHRTDARSRRSGRWRGASGGVAEEKRRAGEAAAAEADIFLLLASCGDNWTSSLSPISNSKKNPVRFFLIPFCAGATTAKLFHIFLVCKTKYFAPT
jgi:hypothetical protein